MLMLMLMETLIVLKRVCCLRYRVILKVRMLKSDADEKSGLSTHSLP